MKEYELKKKNFSKEGNFGFGISEHIDLGLKYDPSTGELSVAISSTWWQVLAGREAEVMWWCGGSAGIYGMDFYVVLGRKGNRVHRRKLKVGRVGAGHRVTKEDAMAWFQQKFEGECRVPRARGDGMDTRRVYSQMACWQCCARG